MIYTKFSTINYIFEAWTIDWGIMLLQGYPPCKLLSSVSNFNNTVNNIYLMNFLLSRYFTQWSLFIDKYRIGMASLNSCSNAVCIDPALCMIHLKNYAYDPYFFISCVVVIWMVWPIFRHSFVPLVILYMQTVPQSICQVQESYN